MSNNLVLLIFPKLSEIAGKLTLITPIPGQWQLFQINLFAFCICCSWVHILVSFCRHNLNAVIYLHTERFLPEVFALLLYLAKS